MRKLTIIAYIGAEYPLDVLLTSLERQKIYQKKAENQFREIPQIQLIVTDSVGEATTQSTIEQQLFPQTRLEYLNCTGKNLAECYNAALSHIQGDYVSFVDIDSKYSPKAILHLCEILEDSEIPEAEKQCVCIRPIYVRPEGIENNYKIYPGTTGVRDLTVNTAGVNLCLYSYFVRSSLVKDMRFEERFPVECRALFCIELMEKVEKYYCKNGPSIRYFHPLEDAKGLFAAQHQKEWYMHTLNECYLPFVQKRYEAGTLTYATEAAMLYLLYWRFACNMGVSDNEILTEEEVEELYQAAFGVSRYFSYETLLLQYKVKNQKLEPWLLWKFLEHKIQAEGSTYQVKTVDGIAFLRVMDQKGENNRYTLFNFQDCKATVYAIDYENGQIRVDLGLHQFSQIILEQYAPQIAVSSGSIEETEIYNDRLCFGKRIGKPVIYRAYIPLNEVRDFQQFYFSLQIQGHLYQLRCAFANRPAVRLMAGNSENYWYFAGNRVLQYQPARQRFVIETCTRTKLMSLEANFCRAIRQDRTLTEQAKLDLIELRREYWNLQWNHPPKKPIWITYDKLYKAGDNGEYLFHYVREHCPQVDIYYLITEHAADYERLKSDDHVLIHGTKEAKLKVLQAQMILATHTNTMSGCGFTAPGERLYLRNLYQAQIVCIQHGLTVQDIAVWQNVLCDNTKLYCCASENEIKNIRQPEYGYTKEQIALTGLARYDGLVSKDKRQILITPTWRRNLVNAGSSGNVRVKNSFFKDTEYYRIYNSLINDKRLIESAKKNNYRILYLIHPTLSSQIDDFEKNEYVDIVAAAGDMSYEKVLTESSLMITDYSGVQFDFAYMRKPILYYHPSSLPPHYTQSIAFTYEEMGFGPIITEHETLVDQICSYMEQECRMDAFYKERADQFFAYDDTENCKRIAEAVLQFSEQLAEQKNPKPLLSDSYDFLQITEPKMLGSFLQKPQEKKKSGISKVKRVLKRWKRKIN